MAKKLTNKQARFVEEYLVDLNATAAARRAGYSAKNADKIGPELVGKTRIMAAIQEKMSARSERTNITQDRVLRELARVAFFDPRKMFDDAGGAKHVTKLDDDTAAAVAGLDVATEIDRDNDSVETTTRKYKIADKLRALELLGKHLGMFRERVTIDAGEDGEALGVVVLAPVMEPTQPPEDEPDA